MCSAITASDNDAVLIELLLHRADPPAGRVQVEGRPAADFDGYLGLLRVLADVLACAGPIDPDE